MAENDKREREGNKVKLTKIEDVMHDVKNFLSSIAKSTLSMQSSSSEYNLMSAMENLNSKISFSDAFITLVGLTNSHTNTERIFFFLQNFKFCEEISYLRHQKFNIAEGDKKHYDALEFTLLTVAHLQSLTFVIYRTEEYSEQFRSYLLQRLLIFFSDVKLKNGMGGSFNPSNAIKTLMKCKAKNYALQLSTQPSYAILSLVYYKNISEYEEIREFVDSLTDTIIISHSSLYGCVMKYEIHRYRN